MNDEYVREALADMEEQREELAQAVVGHKIVSAVEGKFEDSWYSETALLLTLDNGTQVKLQPTSDCCSYSELKAFLLDPASIDHIITDVKTENDYEQWYILADMHQVLKLDLEWSEGNYPYYPFGFQIEVIPVSEQVVEGEVVMKELP